MRQSQKVEHDPNLAQHKRDFANDQKNLKLVYDAGVKVGFGTDSGAMPARVPGFAEHQELAMMVQSGLTPMQAIDCATKTNAELLGIEQDNRHADRRQAGRPDCAGWQSAGRHSQHAEDRCGVA